MASIFLEEMQLALKHTNIQYIIFDRSNDYVKERKRFYNRNDRESIIGFYT